LYHTLSIRANSISAMVTVGARVSPAGAALFFGFESPRRAPFDMGGTLCYNLGAEKMP